MPYVYEMPSSVTFRGKGLYGYSFGTLKQKDVEVLYIESEKGHDTFMVCKGVTRTYYILNGSGSFTIEGREYGVRPGVLVEAPRGVEYSYSGRMTMLAFCKRSWRPRKDKWTRWNRDVVGPEDPRPLDGGPWLKRLIGLRILGKSPANAFLRLNQYLWNLLPSRHTALRAIDSYGHFLHRLARIQDIRAQAFSTFFLRNRPELELIRRLIHTRKRSDTIRLAVLGCSAGAEVYSIVWTIKKERPDLRVVVHAVDVAPEVIEFAQRGEYSLKARGGNEVILDNMAGGRRRIGLPGSELVGAEVFERMTAAEIQEMFDLKGDTAVVKDWIKEGIDWHVGDVKSPELLDSIGLQDIVVASNFLCHMEDPEAENCLRNIARLAAPQGYIFVSGIDLGVRTRVARELGWEPVDDLIEEIHYGDPCMIDLWPCYYCAVEPLNKRKRDWKTRYAAVFSAGASGNCPHDANKNELVHG